MSVEAQRERGKSGEGGGREVRALGLTSLESLETPGTS
jgi:hypothetical protein